MNKALIVVDMQNDFMPKGSLPVKKGDKIIKGINILLNSDLFVLKIGTKDSHPFNHCSFKDNGGFWPKHCIKGTYGWEFANALNNKKFNYVIEKGTSKNFDSYSAFYDDKNETELKIILNKYNIKEVYIVGVALDYCIKATAIDSDNFGYTTYVIKHLTKPVNKKSIKILKNKLNFVGKKLK